MSLTSHVCLWVCVCVCVCVVSISVMFMTKKNLRLGESGQSFSLKTGSEDSVFIPRNGIFFLVFHIQKTSDQWHVKNFSFRDKTTNCLGSVWWGGVPPKNVLLINFIASTPCFITSLTWIARKFRNLSEVVTAKVIIVEHWQSKTLVLSFPNCTDGQ